MFLALAAPAVRTAAEEEVKLEAGEILQHEVVEGPFGPAAKGLLVFTARSDLPPVGFAGFVVVDGRRIPLPVDDDGHVRTVEAVLLEDLDGDGEIEPVLLTQYMTGIGPEGAYDQPGNAVFDWNGERFVRLPGPTAAIARAENAQAAEAALRKWAARPEAAVGRVLDDFHDAASKADGARYFDHFAPGGVFVGTDATEVWTLEAFRKYAEPVFAKGKGWTYTPDRETRRIEVKGDTAWFYEPLFNAKYGWTRGSGVLVKKGGRWRVAQYVLSFPIPNDATADVVARVKAQAASQPAR